MSGDRPAPASTSGGRFPVLEARDLERRPCTLPAAFTGRWNLVLVAFRREHQSDVDTWTAWHAETEALHPDLECFEVPVLGVKWLPARWFIDGGMAQAVRDPVVRRRTLTVYTNVAGAAYALDIAGAFASDFSRERFAEADLVIGAGAAGMAAALCAAVEGARVLADRDRQGGDAAVLGTAAPGLQIARELLARLRGVEPQLTQLFAHHHHLVERRVRGACLGNLRARVGGHLLLVDEHLHPDGVRALQVLPVGDGEHAAHGLPPVVGDALHHGSARRSTAR